MSDLDRTVRLAQRRLWLNRWLRVLGWSAVIAAGAYVLAAVPNKLLMFTEHPWYYPGAALGAVGLALVVSSIWFLVTRDDRFAAAAALDVAAGLKERISSGLYCAQSTDPFGQAVYEDAGRISRSISPRSHLRVAFPRSAAYALGTIALALLVSFVIPPLDLLGKQEAKKAAEEREKPIAKAKEVVTRRFDRIREMAKDNPLLQKMDGLQNLDPQTEAKAQSSLDVRQNAVKQIDNLIKGVQERQARSERGTLDAMNKMLRRVSDLQKGQDSSMEKLNKALAAGDFQAAREALDELKKKAAENAQTPEQKQQAEALQKQLASLSEKLDKAAAAQQLDKKLAEQLQKAGIDARELEKKLSQLSREDLEKIAKQLEKQGVSKEQIEEAIRKIQEQSKACKACKNLADGLGKAGQGMARKAADQNAGAAAAAQGLSAADQQLSELEQMQQEVNQLEAAMNELQSAKADLGKPCGQCNGTGMCNGKPCGRCGGSGLGGGDRPGSAGGRGGGMGARGIGEGGIAPEEVTAFKTNKQRSPVKTGPGSLIGQTWVDGEQIKGQANSEYVETAISAERDVAEAINQEKMPRQYHKTVGKYFERISRDAQDAAGKADK